MSMARGLTSEVSCHSAAASDVPELVSMSGRMAVWQQLSRPRIAVMSAVSAAAGFTLASVNGVDWPTMLLAIVGIVCFVAASSILNQVLERATDARMPRTWHRPLVVRQISVLEATLLGVGCAVLGLAVLCLGVNTASGVASLATMLVYVLIYTPLKARSILCTTIGAVPGAMPPVLGWLAAGGNLGVEAAALFAIFFVWQFPHFLAIAWIYRDQYRQAGLKMLPSQTDQGRLAGCIALIYAAAFVPVSCLPRFIGLAGSGYLAAALVLSLGYLWLTLRFALDRTQLRARQLMVGSLLCLPALLIALLADFLRLTS